MRLVRLESGTCEILADTRVPGQIAGIPADRLADHKKLRTLLSRCAREGTASLPSKVFKPADKQNGIWEFKAGRYRAYCFKVGGRLIVVSSVHLKKQQKAPQREVQKAIRAKNRYQQASERGNLDIV